MRARSTTPWPLQIGFSKFKEAGRGVWVDYALPENIVFGPYEGIYTKSVAGEESGYGWMVNRFRFI